MILFGLAVGILGTYFMPVYCLRQDPKPNTFTEFQIPPQLSRHANFLFSFIGRGICKLLTISTVAITITYVY